MTNMIFALADGNCAGLRVPDGVQNEAVGTADVPCSEKDVSVVFYASNKQSLNRVLTRFGQERTEKTHIKGERV
jgi:hypothetical protein